MSMPNPFEELSAKLDHLLAQVDAIRTAQRAVVPPSQRGGVKDCAAWLGRSRDWVYTHLASIPHSKPLGGHPSFRRDEVEAWMEEQFEKGRDHTTPAQVKKLMRRS